MYVLRNLTDPRDNPGVALYNYWATALDGWFGPPVVGSDGKWDRSHSMGLGPSNYGVGVIDSTADPDPNNNKPVLGFGYNYGVGAGVHPMFQLTASGEFRLTSLYGWKQRDIVAKNTFLTWDHWSGQYSWRYEAASPHGGSYARKPKWTDPIHYVNERALGISSGYNRNAPAWCRLERQNGEWTIQFSRSSNVPHAATKTTIDSFVNMDKLREQRYRRWERADKIAQGLITARPRSASLTDEEIAKRFEKDALALKGLLVVGAPLTTTPLRRKEAS